MLAAKLSQALAADQTLCQPRGVILDSASVAEPEQESPVKLQELERYVQYDPLFILAGGFAPNKGSY